jgi:hypothetical protein
MSSQSFANIILVDDFEDISDWEIGGGSSRGSNSTKSPNSSEAQVGANAAAFTYDLTESQSFNYVDFYKWNTSFYDLTKAISIDFYLKQANDPDMLLQLRIASSERNGFLEYNLPEGNGSWQFFSLKISDFADYGTTPDLSRMNIFIFRANGDITKSATLNTLYVDDMKISPVSAPATLFIFCISCIALICTRKNDLI